jgi:hypothetical protein
LLGYAGKTLTEYYRERRAARTDRGRALKRLAALIDESASVRRTQRYLANQLFLSIKANHPSIVAGTFGYDEPFRAAYDSLTESEKEVHTLLRSMTMNSALRLHEALREWMDKNTDIIHDLPTAKSSDRLREELEVLKEYLNDWLARYHARVADDKTRADVFLRDGQTSPTLFPRNLASSVVNVIAELG